MEGLTTVQQGCPSKFGSKGRLSVQSGHGLGHGFRGADVHEKPRTAFLQDLRYSTAGLASDHGQSLGHGFHYGIAKRFLERRVNQHIYLLCQTSQHFAVGDETTELRVE